MNASIRPAAAFCLTAAVTAAVAAQVGPYPPGTGPWQPDRFQVFCGTPAPNTNFGWAGYYTIGVVETTFGETDDTRNPRHYRYYLDHLGEERDDPDPGCLPPERIAELEDMAHHALLFYKGIGASAGRQFTDVSPERLGPVVLDESGERVVRLYADPTFTGVGETGVQAVSGGGIAPWSVGHVRFNIGELTSQPPWSRYRIVAHELAHVVQYSQAAYIAGPRVDGKAPGWVTDGTADALAAAAMKNRGHDPRPPLTLRGSRSVYGLRPYDRALTWVSGDLADQHGNKLITDYTASSFWTYLADRYFEGSFRYLIDWFAVPDPHQGRDDWLEWVDDLLRFDDGGIDEPLYLVFPDFIANYAAWGHKKYPNIGEEEWLRNAFTSCETVTLTPAEPVQPLDLELEPLSAACVKVKVDGVDPGEVFAVQWMAYEQDTDKLDNLHLTASRLGGTIGGEPFECYDYAKAMGPSALCIDKPFTGSKGRQLADIDQGGVTNRDGFFVKTWLGAEQEHTGGGSVENLYFMVHAPVYPKDAEHDVMIKPGEQYVQVEIGLERHRLAQSGSTGKKATASVNGTAGLGTVPMQGGEGSQAEGPEGLLASITAAMNAGTNPEAMSQTMFLQNTPMGTLLPGAGPCEDGICTIMIEEKETRPDGYGRYELATTSALSLSLEEPIPFGGSGTYKAVVSGCAGESCDDGIKMGEGQVSVIRFDDEVLHLHASGSYCVIRGLASLSSCQDPTPFEAEVLKPFGWAYDRARTFTSIDTPGMAEYREYLSKSLAGVIPNAPGVWRKQVDAEPVSAGEPGSSDGGAGEGVEGGSTGGGVVAPMCDCSCDGYRALMDAVAAYQAEAQAAEDAGRQPAPPPPEVGMVTQCAMQCAMQWGSCQR